MEEQKYLKTWFTSRNLSKGTQRVYKSIIELYKEYTGESFEKLIDEAENEEINGVRPRKRKIIGDIVGFKSDLEDKGLAPGTVRNHINAVISFYKAFDIQTPDIILPKGDIGLEKNQAKLLTREEIKAMIDAANIRDKALIYFLALTGMSQAEARHFTFKKLLDSASETIGKEILDVNKLFEYEEELLGEIILLDIVRRKVNYKYQTFLPPEAFKPLITYIKTRQFNRNERLHIKDINAPIFVTKDGTPMSRTGVGNEIKRVGILAGFSRTEGAYCYWRPHAMRKYFISTIINEIGDHILADYLAGHKIDNIKRAYWIAGPEVLKKKYMEVLPFLSIDQEVQVDIVNSKEYAELKDENTYLKSDIKGIKDKIADLNDLKRIIKKPAVQKAIKQELTNDMVTI